MNGASAKHVCRCSKQGYAEKIEQLQSALTATKAELKECKKAFDVQEERIGFLQRQLSARLLIIQPGKATSACDTNEQLSAQPRPEVCICAALLLDNGYIVRGHTHADCYSVAKEFKPIEVKDDGFVTSNNRFVDREEGMKLQLEAEIPSIRLSGFVHSTRLYSEDLY